MSRADVGEDAVDDLLEWLAGEGQSEMNIGQYYAGYPTDVNDERIAMAGESFCNFIESGRALPDGWPNVNYATADHAWRIACERAK